MSDETEKPTKTEDEVEGHSVGKPLVEAAGSAGRRRQPGRRGTLDGQAGGEARLVPPFSQ